MLARWNAGCHTGAVIVRALDARGYQGGRTTLCTYITQLRKAAGLPPHKRSAESDVTRTAPARRVPSSRPLTGLVLRPANTRTTDAQTQVDQLRQAHAELATAITLTQDFATMVRERQPGQRDAWLERVGRSGIAPLISVANGLRRDYAAVTAGVTVSQ